MINNTNEQRLYIRVKQGAKFTWMPAHKESFGIVLIKPNSDRSRKSNPGAKSSTFIFTDTAKLSEQRKEFVTCDKKKKTIFALVNTEATLACKGCSPSSSAHQ